MPGPLRVEIDKSSCLSSGTCIALAPEAFDWDDDALGGVLPGAAEMSRKKLLEAARRCPAFAITVFDADGNEIPVDG